ncbi:MAG: uncharacterized protein QOI77_929 [Blastocatellia bacterium]|nr:uncharacterized protein [Blastocatellia bacterium]
MHHPSRWRTSSIFLIVLCILFLMAGCARKSNRTTKVTVAGEAISRVEPDTAVVSLSVVTQSPQAFTAQQENARKSEAVSNSVKAVAGSNVEIKTSDYTLQPQYDPRDNSLPKIVGYDAHNTVIVTMSDLKNVGAVIDAASRAGANSIDGISFVLRQTSPARGQALADATQQALNKARSIAEALGGRVLRVVEENESSTVGGVPETTESFKADSTVEKARTPIAAGLLSIRSNVQLIVEVES